MYAERAKGLGMEFSELEKGVLELTPLRKYAKHDEVAKAALFLASSDSSHTTGESLNVSGGQLNELIDGGLVLPRSSGLGHGRRPAAIRFEGVCNPDCGR